MFRYCRPMIYSHHWPKRTCCICWGKKRTFVSWVFLISFDCMCVEIRVIYLILDETFKLNLRTWLNFGDSMVIWQTIFSKIGARPLDMPWLTFSALNMFDLTCLFCLQLPDLRTIYPFRIYGDGAECQGQLFVYIFLCLNNQQNSFSYIYMYTDSLRRGELWNHFAYSCCLSIELHDGLTLSATYLKLV